MGGQLPWLIRDVDERIYFMDRHTSEVVRFVTKKFIIENFKTFVCNLNCPSGPIDDMITYPNHEYGLIVIDYVTNTIVDCNGYATVGCLYSSDLKSILIEGRRELYNPYGSIDTQYYDLIWLAETHRYVKTSIIDVNKKLIVKDLKNITWDKFQKIIDCDYKDHRIFDPVVVDLSPWTVFSYLWTKEYNDFMNKLADIGFPLHAKHVQAFSRIIMDYKYK